MTPALRDAILGVLVLRAEQENCSSIHVGGYAVSASDRDNNKFFGIYGGYGDDREETEVKTAEEVVDFLAAHGSFSDNDLAEWANITIETVLTRDKFDYADNYRWTIVDDAAGARNFEEIKRRGCCGSYEAIVLHPNGMRVKIGFNYGH